MGFCNTEFHWRTCLLVKCDENGSFFPRRVIQGSQFHRVRILYGTRCDGKRGWRLTKPGFPRVPLEGRHHISLHEGLGCLQKWMPSWQVLVWSRWILYFIWFRTREFFFFHSSDFIWWASLPSFFLHAHNIIGVVTGFCAQLHPVYPVQLWITADLGTSHSGVGL